MSESNLGNRLAGLHSLLCNLETLDQRRAAVLETYSNLYTPYKKKWGAKMYWLWVLVGTVVLTILMGVITGTILTSWSNTHQGEPPVGITFLLLTPLPLALILAGVFVKIRNKRLLAKNAQIDAINQATAQKIADLAAPEIAPIEAELRKTVSEYRENYADWSDSAFLRNTEDVAALWNIVQGEGVK